MLSKKCPLCNSGDRELLLELDCGNIDESTLYEKLRLLSCGMCGHIYNDLSDEEIEGLAQYYSAEYAPANLSATDAFGDRPGSAGSFTIERYEQLYSVLSPFLTPRQEILDVGCATGGFLDFLHEKGYTSLCGVDMTKGYADLAKLRNLYRIEHGNAENLPFENGSFDVVVMEQVMEHLVNPAKGFQEARRVLRPGGYLCVGVPDASRYAEQKFFDFYWLLLREHIQHFDLAHLEMIAQQEGFGLLVHRRTKHTVMSHRMVMPNLYAIFQYTQSEVNSRQHREMLNPLQTSMKSYIGGELLQYQRRKQMMAELRVSQRPVYVWGIGREFLYLYESTGLKYCNIAALIDVNALKQEKFTVDGKPIVDSRILTNAGDDSVLIITAVAHTEAIKNTVANIGFRGIVHSLDDFNEDRIDN